MKNTIYFNAEFAPLLLVNEEQVGSNSIVINIEADSTADQSLLVTMDSGTTTSLTVTPGQENSLAIDEAYWSLGGSTFVSLVKGGLTSNSITLVFPETINTDAALEETSNLTYTMTGSNTVTEQIDNLDDRVAALEQGGESEKEVYYGTTLPTTDIGQDSSLYYKIIQRPEDLKTLNVVEYIQSATASYIPTDILVTNNTRIMMQGIFTRGSWVGGQRAFGAYKYHTGNTYQRIVAGTAGGYNSGKAFFHFGDDNSAREIPGVYGTDAMVMVDVATRTLTVSGDGGSHSVTIPSTVLFTPPDIPLGILCENISSETGGFEIDQDWRYMNADAIIKRFQVYYNNVLAYDLIPVQNANDVTDCGLYDRIHRKYYPGENYYNYTPFTAGTATGEVINQLDECVEAGYLRVNDEWWEIYNGGTEYFAGNYIEITENNVITSTLKAGTNIQIADDGTISASGADIVQIITSGTQLATINGTSIYAPTVSATQTQTSGTEIAEINVGDTSTKLYAPTTTVTQVLSSGTEIAQINGTSLYAPTGGGSDVTVTPKTSSGTNIADIEVDGTIYQLFAPSGGGGGSSGHNYSTTEQVVGTWIDGSTLYEKTIDFGALPLSTTKTVAHNIANVDKIWVYDGFVYNSTGRTFSQLNRTTNSLTYQWETSVDRTNVIMQDYAAFGNDCTAIVTVRYTKTS